MGRILVIRGGAVGDFILTLPAIKLLRESLPGNEIEVLGHPAIAGLATAAGLADRVRSIEDSRLALFFAPGADLDPEWCAYFAGFDLVISYLYDPDGHFAGSLERAGVQSLLCGPFRPEESAPFVSAARQLARPLESLALFLEDADLQLPYPVADPWRRAAPGPLVALHPGSGSASKNWSYESWAAVLDRLAAEWPGVEFLITSGEAERETIGDFLAMLAPLRAPWRHLDGASLPEIAALLRQVDLYLGHDSGISHLAASAGARGVLLFGPTNPEIWAPETPRMKPLRSADSSLASIRVEEVVVAALRTSSSQGGRREDF